MRNNIIYFIAGIFFAMSFSLMAKDTIIPQKAQPMNFLEDIKKLKDAEQRLIAYESCYNALADFHKDKEMRRIFVTIQDEVRDKLNYETGSGTDYSGFKEP